MTVVRHTHIILENDMYTIVTEYSFRQAFKDHNRSNNFTYNALNALYEALEELEENTGVPPVELDVIAICCEWTEYTDINEVKSVYGDIKDLEDLYDHTWVVEFPGGILVNEF